VAYNDYEIRRVIQHFQDLDRLDNTLDIYINRDNGTSAEGGQLGTPQRTHKRNDRAWRAASSLASSRRQLLLRSSAARCRSRRCLGASSQSSLAVFSSGSVHGSAADVPRVTAFAASRGCRHVQSWPPACLWWRQSSRLR
jgi:hypothetical protein